MRVTRLTTLTATLASVLLLPACGQKGPLYLPQDSSLTTTPVSTSTEESSPTNTTDKKATDIKPTDKDETAAKR